MTGPLRLGLLLLLTVGVTVSLADTCVRTGSLTQPTTPTNPSATVFGTGVTCTPKVVLFFWNNKTADGGAAESVNGFGAASSTSERFAGWARASNAVTTMDTDRAFSVTSTIIAYNTSGTLLAEADLVSLNTDGFSLNWSTADAVARIVSYMAIGGSDVTNARVGSYTASGSPQDITSGIGWQPDLLVLYRAGVLGSATGFSTSIGITTATDSWATATNDVNGAATNSTTRRYQRVGKSFVAILHTSTTVVSECTSTFLSTGFRQTCPTQGSLLTGYIVLKGGLYKAGTFNQPVTSIPSTISGIGFTPVGILLATGGLDTQATVQTGVGASIGAGTSSTDRFGLWYGSRNTGNALTSQYLDRSKLFITKLEAGASPTAVASADLTSFASDTATLSWTSDGVAREMLYLVIGASGGGAPATRPARRITQ